MKYYKVLVKLGHLGCGKSATAWVYVQANSMLHAIKLAGKFHGVKHNKLPPTAMEISHEEFLENKDNTEFYRCRQSIFDGDCSV